MSATPDTHKRPLVTCGNDEDDAGTEKGDAKRQRVTSAHPFVVVRQESTSWMVQVPVSLIDEIASSFITCLLEDCTTMHEITLPIGKCATHEEFALIFGSLLRHDVPYVSVGLEHDLRVADILDWLGAEKTLARVVAKIVEHVQSLDTKLDESLDTLFLVARRFSLSSVMDHMASGIYSRYTHKTVDSISDTLKAEWCPHLTHRLLKLAQRGYNESEKVRRIFQASYENANNELDRIRRLTKKFRESYLTESAHSSASCGHDCSGPGADGHPDVRHDDADEEDYSLPAFPFLAKVAKIVELDDTYTYTHFP